MGDQPEVVLFEGIMTVYVGDVLYDTYATIKSEIMGSTIRWYGSFGWMSKEPPKAFEPGGFFDVSLSDGREAKIRVPYLSPEESGRLDFLGVGLPPGFEYFGPEMITAELLSTTPSRVRVLLSLWMGICAFFLLMATIWHPEARMQLLATTAVFAFGSALISVPPKGRQIKEADSGVDSDTPPAVG